MNNEERRSRIADFQQKISLLDGDLFRASITYDFWVNKHREYPTADVENKLENAKEGLRLLNEKALPLFNAMRELQVPYEVEVEVQVLEGGILVAKTGREILYLSTDCKNDLTRDSKEEPWNEDEQSVILEIAQHISRIYSRFRIKQVKRLSGINVDTN